MEVDRQSERRKQAPPPLAANLQTLGEEVADRPEVVADGPRGNA